MEKYNKYHESLDIDCGCNKPKPKPKVNNDCCCGGINLPSHDNEIEVLIRQLKREVNELLKTTQAKLLCQDKKIAETMVYIKNNLSNAIRNLLDSMITSGEMEEIIKTIITDNVSTLQTQIDNLTNDVNNLSNIVNLNTNAIELNEAEIDKIKKRKSKMIIIGDSWSIDDYPYLDNVTDMWEYKVAKELDLEVKNYSVSGSGFTVSNNLFLSQLNNAINDNTYSKDEVKYIFIFGGINDLDLGVPTNVTTNCNNLITTARNYFKNSQIILMGCNTQVKFKKGTNNPTYNTMDITNYLQESAITNSVTFIDTMPFLYGRVDTINQHAHPSLIGMNTIAYGVLSSLKSTYTRPASVNANASYNLTSDMDNAPTMIIQSSCKNNTLTLLFFINGIVSSNTEQGFLYRIPELNLPYMNAEPMKNLSTGEQKGCIWVTSDNAKFFRVKINANYSGSLYFEKTIQI